MTTTEIKVQDADGTIRVVTREAAMERFVTAARASKMGVPGGYCFAERFGFAKELIEAGVIEQFTHISQVGNRSMRYRGV